MLKTDTIDYHTYLPPYRSLLNPTARYDYRTHSLIPLSQNELNTLHSNFSNRGNLVLSFNKGSKDGSGNRGGTNNSSSNGFKMKYKSLLGDVSRTLSMRLSNPNLIASAVSSSSGSQTMPSSNPPTRSSNVNNSMFTSSKFTPPAPTVQFQSLPIEILDYIFSLVDSKSDLKSCLYTNKLFYFFAKPYYYQDLHFTSTYRFAQFITYLRLNSEIGQYVKTVDLSSIKPGYDEDIEEDDEAQEQNNLNEDTTVTSEQSDEFPSGTDKILAGWRDWKFKSNPLYSIHPASSSVCLTKISSNSQISMISSKSTASSHKSLSSKRFSKPFKYFKSKKRSRSHSSNGSGRKAQRLEFLNLGDGQHDATSSILHRNSSPHPLINKFLLNYSSSKDIPIGYLLHLINLCPNVVSLNLGNLSLSMDYEISRSTIYKYQTFDLMNNYPKDLPYKIDELMRFADYDDLSFEGSIRNGSFHNNGNLENGSFQGGVAASIRQNAFSSSNFFKSNQSSSSTASSVYSITTFSKPIRKYNSLLPPLPQTVADISYLNKGDGKVYLSDLNLKSINNNYLKKLNEEEVLSAIIRVHGSSQRNTVQLFNNFPGSSSINFNQGGKLKYLNLSSMIWLNKASVHRFLESLTQKTKSDYYGYLSDEECYDMDLESVSDDDLGSAFNPAHYKQELVIDLTDSGMYKNLQWAKKIDLNTHEGCKLVHKIIKDELYDSFDEFLRRERARRGRMGENYLA
ncbi:uncharacterized protein RJT20DRAFT_16437 [Scheffersomyces xylosifermentans]|uniref:uncharacterized protein n=1 Tax=Scheffersomyces xylosifermentans TaxID=1304137 RepID=UPI00315CED47